MDEFTFLQILAVTACLTAALAGWFNSRLWLSFWFGLIAAAPFIFLGLVIYLFGAAHQANFYFEIWLAIFGPPMVAFSLATFWAYYKGPPQRRAIRPALHRRLAQSLPLALGGLFMLNWFWLRFSFLF